MGSKKTGGDNGHHEFGSNWTRRKLDLLAGYLKAYTLVLKNQPFCTGYIDAFAGTGTVKIKGAEDEGQASLFNPEELPEVETLLAGSVRRSLEVDPPFDKYIFIERSARRCKELHNLKTEYPDRIVVHQNDANEVLQDICSKGKNWQNHRAVLFLDPYGLQVEWKTIEAVAATRAIDMWLLFPLGIGVNRMLTRSGEIPATWRRQLNDLLGTESWYDEFYETVTETNLFGDTENRQVKRSLDVIINYVTSRLESVFAGVADPGYLENSKGNPIFLLFFAVANPKGKRLALRIANDLLKDIQKRVR